MNGRPRFSDRLIDLIPGTLARRTTAAGWVSLWDVQEGLMGWVTPDGIAGALVYQTNGTITATLSDGSTEQYGAAAEGQSGGAAHVLVSRTMPGTANAVGFTETWTPPATSGGAWTVTTVWTSGITRLELATRGLTLADQEGSNAAPPTRTITAWTTPANTLSAVSAGLTIPITDPSAPVQATLSDGRILTIATDGTVAVAIHPAPAQSGDPLPAAVETLAADGTHTMMGSADTTRTLADGTVVMAASTITHPDGSIETQDASGRQTSLTTADGSIAVTWPDGSVRTTTAAGAITSLVTADGTAATQQANGAWQATLSDGTVIAWTAAGVLNSHAEPVPLPLPLPNETTGTRLTVYVVETDGPLTGLLAGAMVVQDPDGTQTWTRADGTLWKTWSGDGVTQSFFDAQGRQTTVQIYNAEEENNAAGTILLRTETYAVSGWVASQRTQTVLNADQAAQNATATSGPIPALAAGTTLIDQADGSQRAVDGPGQVLVVISASGHVAVWNGDGTWTVTAPDSMQTTVTPDSGTGQWVVTEADTTVTTFAADGTLVSAARSDGSSVAYTNASALNTTVMTTTDASGILTTQAVDGTVTVQYPTTSQADGATGLYIAQQVTAPDGTVTETFEADQVITTRLTQPDGSVTLTLSDGTTVATNGHTITTTLADGVIYTRDGYGRVFQQDNAQADNVQLSAQGVVVQTLANAVVLTWQAGGRFVLDLGTGRTLEDAPSGEHVLTQANGDRITAGITGFSLVEHADGTWTRSWPTGMTAAAFPAASDGTANPAASVQTTVALDASGALIVTLPDDSTLTTADAFTETPGTPVASLASGSSAVEQADGSLVITTTPDAQGRFTLATWAADGTVTVATQQSPSNEDGSVNLNGMPSFVEQWVSAPDGTAILITPGADIAGPENTTISTTVTHITAPNGTVTTTEPDATLDANNQPTYHTTVQSVDGTTVITQADGSSQTTFLDGSSQSQATDGTLRHWAADGKTLTTTLTDGSVIDRAANGTLTATLPTGGSSLLTQNADSSWTATLSGVPWTWANDGSGAITTVAADGTQTAQRLDGTTITTKSDSTIITQYANGRTVQATPDGQVISQSSTGARWQEDVAQGTVTVASAQGATWQILPDPQVTVWAQDGTVTQTTDKAGSSTTWRPDGSQTSVANGLTTTRAVDGTKMMTTSTGDSVSISATGTVTANGVETNAIGSYALGSGTQVAPNGVITTTLDDGSILTEQVNGVVTLHAVDGTETTWTPPGVSQAYPNGFVTRTTADGSSEGWYTADDQHLDTLYQSLASPTAPVIEQVYGNGVQMQVESTTTALPLTVVTPNGAVLTAGAGGLTAPGVRTETQHALETRSDVAIEYGRITEDPATGLRSPLAPLGYYMEAWSQPWHWPPVLPQGPLSPRTAGATTEGAALPVSLMDPYRLSDANGAGLAQLAASGKPFAIGASLDHPDTLWTGTTVEEQAVMVTRRVSVTKVTNVLVIHIDRVSVYDDFGNYVGYAMTGWHPEYQQYSDPPVSHDEPAYPDGWNYIIDGVTHHSDTRLKVWALTPPVETARNVAEFYVDPPLDDSAAVAQGEIAKRITYDKITQSPTERPNAQTGTPEYVFELDGVQYVAADTPPVFVTKPPSTSNLPKIPVQPLSFEATGQTVADAPQVQRPAQVGPSVFDNISARSGVTPILASSNVSRASVIGLQKALDALPSLFPIRGANRLALIQNGSVQVQLVPDNALPQNVLGQTAEPAQWPPSPIIIQIRASLFEAPFVFNVQDLHNPVRMHNPPVQGTITLLHELDHARHYIGTHLNATIDQSPPQPNYDIETLIGDQMLSLVDINQDARPDLTLWNLFSEYIAYRDDDADMEYALSTFNHHNRIEYLVNNQSKQTLLSREAADLRQKRESYMGQRLIPIKRLLEQYIASYQVAGNVLAFIIKHTGGNHDVFFRFKRFIEYFLRIEQMMGSGGHIIHDLYPSPVENDPLL